MLRKSISYVLIICILVSLLTGCGGEECEQQPTETKPTEEIVESTSVIDVLNDIEATWTGSSYCFKELTAQECDELLLTVESEEDAREVINILLSSIPREIKIKENAKWMTAKSFLNPRPLNILFEEAQILGLEFDDESLDYLWNNLPNSTLLSEFGKSIAQNTLELSSSKNRDTEWYHKLETFEHFTEIAWANILCNSDYQSGLDDNKDSEEFRLEISRILGYLDTDYNSRKGGRLYPFLINLHPEEFCNGNAIRDRIESLIFGLLSDEPITTIFHEDINDDDSRIPTPFPFLIETVKAAKSYEVTYQIVSGAMFVYLHQNYPELCGDTVVLDSNRCYITKTRVLELISSAQDNPNFSSEEKEEISKLFYGLREDFQVAE